MHKWMGAVFYRGVLPSGMGYAELKYYARWSRLIAKTEADAVADARGVDA